MGEVNEGLAISCEAIIMGSLIENWDFEGWKDDPLIRSMMEDARKRGLENAK